MKKLSAIFLFGLLLNGTIAEARPAKQVWNPLSIFMAAKIAYDQDKYLLDSEKKTEIMLRCNELKKHVHSNITSKNRKHFPNLSGDFYVKCYLFSHRNKHQLPIKFKKIFDSYEAKLVDPTKKTLLTRAPKKQILKEITPEIIHLARVINLIDVRREFQSQGINVPFDLQRLPIIRDDKSVEAFYNILEKENYLEITKVFVDAYVLVLPLIFEEKLHLKKRLSHQDLAAKLMLYVTKNVKNEKFLSLINELKPTLEPSEKYAHNRMTKKKFLSKVKKFKKQRKALRKILHKDIITLDLKHTK